MNQIEKIEQCNMIEQSATRFLQNRYPFPVRQKLINTNSGYCHHQWRETADLGWMQLPLSEHFDGHGGNAEFVAILMREFGRNNYQSPYFVSAVLCAKVLEKMAKDPVRTDILHQIAEGKAIVSAAFYEKQSRYDLCNTTTSATQSDNGYTLQGSKVGVQYGNIATHLLILARTSGDQLDCSGLSIFLVPKEREGIGFEHHRTHDGGRVSIVQLKNVAVERNSLIGSEYPALPKLQEALNFAIAMLCAELAGVMDSTFKLVLEFVKTRTQFNSSIGSFQSIQHRLVDMYMRCELATSMSREATRAVNDLIGPEQDRLVSAAKAEIGRLSILNAEEAIQLHGAMGMMDEMPVGHFLKRVFVLNSLYGDAEHHQARYRQLSQDQ